MPYFLVIFLRRLDPVLDEVAEEEEGEGFEELEDQGKQPFDHVTPLVHWYPFSDCMMMKYDGGKPSKWLPPHHDSVATTIWCYMLCIKRVS